MSEEILNKQIFHLAVANANLRLALEEIDSIAIRKQSGAAKAMQAVARAALSAHGNSPQDRSEAHVR